MRTRRYQEHQKEEKQMKNKAITLSFDDGFDYDRRLVKLMNQYGLKGTFNLNSGCFGYENTWQTSNGLVVHHLEKEDLRELYRGHEIAAHGLTHGDFAGGAGI